MPRELVSTLDWDGPAMADEADDIIARFRSCSLSDDGC